MKKRKCFVWNCKRKECLPSAANMQVPYCQYHGRTKVDFRQVVLPIVLTNVPDLS